MASTINTNIASLNAQRNLNGSQNAVNTALQRLSSGLRINSAKDDAAGLAISERFTSQINGLNQAVRNANDGISLAQTAEGDLAQIGNNLQRIRSLADQASNATNSDSDRQALQAEVTQLLSEIDRVAKQSSFNGTNLLDGSFTSKLFQVGANAGQAISVSNIVDARTDQLGKVTINEATFTASGAATSLAADQSQFMKGTISVFDKNGNETEIDISAMKISKDADGNVTTDAFNNAVVSAINSKIGETGVFAEVDDDGAIKMTSLHDNVAVHGGTAASSSVAAVYINLQVFTADTDSTAAELKAASGAADIGGLSSASGAATTSGDIASEIDISSALGAQKALTIVDNALSNINSARADLGAIQNRFSSVVTSLQTTSENLSSSRSRIQDADFAEETAALTRAQILQQAGTAMLAQANSLPNNVLTLLQG